MVIQIELVRECSSYNEDSTSLLDDLASAVGITDSSRITITSQRCESVESKESQICVVKIAPPSTINRRLKLLLQNDDHDLSNLHSLAYLLRLRELNQEEPDVEGRSLQRVKISLLKIIPGKKDKLRLQTPTSLVEEERHLQNIMRTDGDIHYIKEDIMLANNLSGNVDYSDSEERMRIERILLGQEVKFEKMHEEDVGKMEEIHEEDVRKFEKLDRDLKNIFMASIAITFGVVFMVGGAIFVYYRKH